MRGLVFFISPIFVTLVACGPVPDQPKSNQEPTVVKATALEGTWQLGCQMDSPLLALPSSEYVENFLILTNNKYVRIQRGFSSPATGETPCSKERLVYTLQERASFKLSKKSSSFLSNDLDSWQNSDWGLIRTSSSDFRIIPERLRVATDWTANKVCSTTDWTLGNFSNVTNKECSGVKLFRSSTISRAIKLEKDEDGEIYIVFGTESQSSDEPSFDLSQKYKKLPGLPLGLKNPNQENTHLVQGRQGNKQK